MLAIAPESPAERFQRHLRARALPVRRGRRRDRGAPADGGRRRRCGDEPVDMPMDVLLGKPPKMQRDVQPRRSARFQPLDLDRHRARSRPRSTCCSHPTVGDKRFLITIGDRTVGGLSRRDQMVGPWQVPVADCAVTAGRLRGFPARRWHGRAHAAGRPRRAGLGPHGGRRGDHQPAGRADRALRIKLSANWMAACGEPGQDAALFDTVKAVGMELCPALGISDPGRQGFAVDAHPLEARTAKRSKVTSPVSLIVSAFATLADVRGTLTPQLRADEPTRTLMLIDLGRGRTAWAARILAQVARPDAATTVPDLDDPQDLKALVAAVNAAARAKASCWRYHDRSDGGLFAALRDGLRRPRRRGAERRHAGHRRRRHQRQPGRIWRRQELGRAGQRAPRGTDAARAVQRRTGRCDPGARPPSATRSCRPLRAHGLSTHSHFIGKPQRSRGVQSRSGATPSRSSARRWPTCTRSGTRSAGASPRLRDNPACADAEHAAAGDPQDPGRCTCELTLRRRRRRRRALPRTGASARRDPARAGRQLRTSRWPTPSTGPASRPSTST